MPTGDRRINLTSKKLLGLTDIKDRFLDFLRTFIEATGKELFPKTGVAALTSIGIAVADEFDLTVASGSVTAFVADGHILKGTAALVQDVKFENTVATVYEIGLQYAEIPFEAEQLRGGTFIYRATEETIGVTADPDNVTDNGATITFEVDSVCEPNVTHAGRLCVVRLKVPKTAVNADAIETRTVAFVGPDNKITTAGLLGQVAGSVSVVAADYSVTLLGPTVSRNTVIKGSPGVAYIGTVTGGGAGVVPSASSTVDQFVYMTGAAGITEVVEFDTAGRTKIRVKAFNAEASTASQIRVYNEDDAAEVFKVSRVGDTYLGHAGLTTSPLLRFLEGDGEAVVGTDLNGVLLIENRMATGISRHIRFRTEAQKTAGKKGLHLVGQTVNVILDAEDSELQFRDDNVETAVPLGSATETALSTASGQNLVGAINTLGQGHRRAYGTLLESGAGGTSPGASQFTVAAGQFVVDGHYFAVPELILAPGVSNTFYAIFDYSAKVYALVNNFEDPAAEDVLLWKFVTDGGGNVGAIVDLRRSFAIADDPVTILVGPGPGRHFALLSEAVACVREFNNPTQGVADPRAFEIVIRGTIDEGATTIDIPSGITIRGVTKDESRIKTSAVGLFRLDNNSSGCKDVTFRDFTVEADGGVPPALDPPRCVWRADIAGAHVERLRISNIDIAAGAGDYLNGVIFHDEADFRDCVIEGVTSTDVTRDFGFIFNNLVRSTVRDCVLNNSAVGAVRAGGELNGIKIQDGDYSQVDGVYVEDFDEEAFHVDGTGESIALINCHGKDCANPGIRIGQNRKFDRVVSCHIEQDDIGGGTASAIECDGDYCVIMANACKSPSDATTSIGVRLETNSKRCTVIGNTLEPAAGAQAVSDGGTNNLSTAATDSDPLNVAGA